MGEDEDKRGLVSWGDRGGGGVWGRDLGGRGKSEETRGGTKGTQVTWEEDLISMEEVSIGEGDQ